MIDIRNINGEVLLSTPINEGSKRKFELMKEDYITLKFSLSSPIFFRLGAYAVCEFGVFEVTDIQKPNYNDRTGGYDYELTLNAHYWRWKNKIFKYSPESAGQEASWNLTATLDVHAGIILRNLKALGYKYNELEYSFSIDNSVENKPQLMSYSNINILDALFEMAKKWDCECWITDNVIHFGRLEFGSAVNFELGNNVESMSRSDSKSDFATRLYVFGSEKNLPANYRKAEQDMVVNGVVQKRLMLPEGTPYIDAYPGMTEAEAIEQVIVFDDIFPKTECVVGEVKSYTSTITDEETKEKHTETFFYFTDTSGFVFKKEYILEGEELRIQFQSGKLNGMEFGCTFRPKGEMFEGDVLATDVYEVVANEDYGRKLPDSTLCPAKGDKFILIGWDSTKIGDTSLIATAENKLKAEGEKAMDKMKVDPSTYSCNMMSDTIYNEFGHNLYEAGQKVKLINPAYFENGRESRIIGFEFNLDIPYDTPTYIVGESASYSRIGDLEEKVDELTLNGQTFVGGNGSGVYLITSYDHTPATEKNTFSAKRLVRELARLLRKDSPDSTAYLLKLLGGAEVGEAIDSFIAGKGTIFDKNGRIQTDRLEVRQSMKVLELIINRLQGMENDFVFSPTRKVLKVEKMDETTYKLLLDPKMEGDLIPFREGNIVYSIVNDLLTGGHNYYTNYSRVLTTNQNEYSMTVSLYPDSEVPGGKNYPPAPGYNISRRGDVALPAEGQSNPDAQSWYLSSSEGRLLFLQNVVKPVLEDYNYALSVGKFPRIPSLKGIVSPDKVGIMAETIVAQELLHFDYNGDIVPNIVYRGNWSLQVATSAKPYRNVTVKSTTPSGDRITKLEQHTVTHLGCVWGCLVDKTTEDPKWNAQGWQLMEGDTNYSMTFESSEGFTFFRGNVNTQINAVLWYGDMDITADVKQLAGMEVEWLRDSGNVPADNSWKPQYADDSKLSIRLSNADVTPDFGLSVRKVKFVCNCFIPIGNGSFEKVSQEIGFTF